MSLASTASTRGTVAHGTVAAWRGGLAALALASLAAAFAARRPALGAVGFLGYFTHLSALIGAAALLAGAAPPLRGRVRVDWLRGAVALYLAITGAVYALLLGNDAPTWTSVAQHRVLPVAVPLDWLVFATAHRLPARRTALLLGWAGVHRRSAGTAAEKVAERDARERDEAAGRERGDHGPDREPSGRRGRGGPARVDPAGVDPA